MYQNAELEIVRFNAEDVLATSGELVTTASTSKCSREAIVLPDVEV